jgi:hypothetical protein
MRGEKGFRDWLNPGSNSRGYKHFTPQGFRRKLNPPDRDHRPGGTSRLSLQKYRNPGLLVKLDRHYEKKIKSAIFILSITDN